MKTYAAIKAEIARLEQRAESARKAEAAGVIGRIKEAIATYGLSASDLGFGSGPSRSRRAESFATTARPASKSAYRDPATGKEWSGKGRPPAWIATAADRDAFLIHSPATSGTKARAGNLQAAGPKSRASKPAPSTKSVRRRKRPSAAEQAAAVSMEASTAAE